MTALMEAVENQRQVYHRSHRPWKSLQDFHIPAGRRLLTHNEKQTRSKCHHLIALVRVSLKGCSPHGTGTLGKQSFLRIEGEFTLPSICNDPFPGSSLLQRYPLLRRFLQVLNKLRRPQLPTCVRALPNDGQPRFHFPRSEVFPPSCSSPLAAPHLQRQGIIARSRATVTGCSRPGPQFRL